MENASDYNEVRPVEGPLSDDDALNRLVSWFDSSETALQSGNELSARDRDYYDGDQWTQNELNELQRRGQPPTISNHIQPKINYILGTEIKTRVDPSALPRTPAHEDDAQAITDALRYIADAADFDHVRSSVFENMLIEGVGACIVEPERVTDENHEPDINLAIRHIPWEQIAYDARSKRKDFSDARWVAAVVWMDLDDAMAHPLYGKYSDKLKSAVGDAKQDSNLYNETSNYWAAKNPARVRIVQMFYRERGKWVEAHFTKGTWVVPPRWVTLRDSYGRSQCPMILGAAYRSRPTQDKPSLCYGAVRIMVSPQDEVNKRRSKALWMLTMGQTWKEDGAIEGIPDAELAQRVAQPDAVISVARGALVEGRVKVERNIELAQGQAQLLAEAKSELDRVGPSAPVVAGDTRIRSGRAELVQQQSSAMELEPVFESMRRWQMTVYRRLWMMARRLWPYEKWTRVRDDVSKTGLRFVPLNRKMRRADRMRELMEKERLPIDQAIKCVNLQPVESDEILGQAMSAAQQQIQQYAQVAAQSGQQIPQEAIPAMMQQVVTNLVLNSPIMDQEFVQNNIAQLDADIVLDVAPDTSVIQDEQFEKLTELMGTGMLKLPENVQGELIVRASQLRNKKELLDLLKTPPPDPMQQQVAQLQVALMEASVEKTKAQTMDLQAHAQQRLADAQFKVTAQTAKTQAQALNAAAEAGAKTMPVIGPTQGA